MKRTAFTIVELLVTMAVISLLVGLLAPALFSAASSARAARCQLNLKQLAAAANNYAVMYDAFPAAIRYEVVSGAFRHVAWDWVTAGTNQIVSPGAIWGFTDQPGETMQCPEYTGASNFGEEFTGYNYNTSFIGGEAPFLQLGWKPVRPGVPPHACSRGSRCAMFGDGGRKGQANKFMRAPLNHESVSLGTIFGGGQAFRHARATNIAFVDGHVGESSKFFPGDLATPSTLTQILGYPNNGFLSNDDSAYDPR